MKHWLIVMMMLCCAILSAAELEQYADIAQGMKVTIQALRTNPMEYLPADPAEGDTAPQSSVISRTYAFPYASAEIQVNSMLWKVFDAEGNYLYSENTLRNGAVSVARCFKFREMAGVTVNIETQWQTEDKTYTLQDVEYEVLGSEPIALPTEVSPAFWEAYKSLADNFNYSYMRTLPLARERILVISHSQLSTYQEDFVAWKRSLGFEVFVVNKSDAGSSLNEIKAFIQNHYQQYHCDYLFLWGDVSGTFSIPTNFYPSPEYPENDADDHYYTLLEGDDYFPEMIVGRFSFNDVSEFLTMCNKTISYEKTPFMTDTTWMRRGLVIAGNYAEGGLQPTTPIHMSRWLRDRMLDYGYTQVDSVFFPPSYPGTSLIQQAINQGVQVISYRGWGDANGWHYPSFHIPDLTSTYNGPKMPIVYSIVCNTGDFANTVNPSFGEKWMRMGSMSSPGGCIAFVGPSDLHTKTRLNNSISSGAFRSIMDQGVRGFGSSVLNGKMELYKNFPNDIAPGMYVPFYYHVYNILSDPTLRMWSLVPETISEGVIQGGLSFAQSDSHVRINAANLDGAVITGTKNSVDFSYARIVNGQAILPIDPNQTGNLKLTISKDDHIPLVRELTPSQNATLGIISNNMANSFINPGSQNTLTLGFKNFSAAAINNASVVLTVNNDEVTITNGTQNIASLAAGATHELSFGLNANNAIDPGQVLTFTVNISNPADQHMFQLMGGGAQIVVYGHTGVLNPGQASNITFNVTNNGNIPMNNISIQALSLSTAASAQGTPISLGNLEVGQSATFTASITVQADAYHGHTIPFKFTATNPAGYTFISYYSAFVGTPVTNDPTGPDEYGYYAYDSTDTAYTQAPAYAWMELDPTTGPLGTVYLNKDDGSHTINLPFTFKYYGVDYNSLTFCTNGWLSFVPNTMVDFYNCYIPAALGPYAMVAAYWDDLKGMKVAEDTFNDIRIIYYHDAANNRFIIEWNNAYNQYNIDLGAGASLEKFQVILYPRAGQDGDIVIQYHTVDNPGTTTNYCTVGVEDHTQLRGLTYTHGNTYPATAAPLASGLAVKFTTTPPDSYVANDDQHTPGIASSLRNYPNPFNPHTNIAFSMSKAGYANLGIYNLKGQLVKTLHNGNINTGEHHLSWDGTDDNGKTVGSGLYLYRLVTETGSQTNKMLLMK